MVAFLVSFVRPSRLRVYSVLAIILLILAFCALTSAEEKARPAEQAPSALIVDRVDESRLTVLKGNTHPLARPEFDLGTAPATLPMERMLLVLKRSPEQQSALQQLLDDRQDKNSPNYHSWLSPEEFGKQFGPTDDDMETITSWLQSHGFQVGATKGRTVLEFSGSASQVQEAFHTTIHKYIVNGEQHWANANDPSIPTALTPAVAGVLTLHNFRKKPMNLFVGRYSEKDKELIGAAPSFTVGCGSGATCYALVPYDFATIYDVLPLWTATPAINGTGQTIAIVGRTNINPSDATTFWSLFGLTVPANKLQITLNGPDPGINGDEGEADIDVEWSGAVAPQATINLVTSQSTETTDGIDLSAVYIVENNLASVMSESYGACELAQGTTGNQFFSALWGQAAAQGITVMVAAGDNGAAGCDDPSGPAQFGLAVSGNASTPYNVAVGGTDFKQYNKLSTYWNSTNNATTQASARGYIPETTWNNSCTNSLAITLGYGTTAEQACNNSNMIAAGGVNSTGGSGGASNCTVNTQGMVGSCTQGYSKPSWQTGSGVPADGKRDLPDVSLFASNGFMYSFYIVCQSDATNGICNLSNLAGFGGTSVSSPAFAGIMALVNQKTGSRQGNANYVLYKLASQQPTSFHDVTVGTIAMPCITGSPNCTTTTAGDGYGVLSGYNTGSHYDLATGLGSVDANILVTKWNSVSLLASTTTLSSLTPTTVTHGQPVNFTVSVKPQSGTGTATGQITLMGGSGSIPQGVGGFTLANGTVSGSTEMLPGGTYSVTAHYAGDATYGSSDSSPVAITVNKENSEPVAFLATFDANGYLINGNTTTAVYGSPYLLRVNVENAAAQMCAPAAASGATACPTGTVTLTNNGSPLDAGTYTLNSYGFFEDLAVQLPGGTNTVTAQYQGDSSFNSSSSTSAFVITPATTSTIVSYVSSGPLLVGQGVTLTATVAVSGTGVPATGTVSFMDAEGTASLGTAPIVVAGQKSTATISFVLTTPGPNDISASYSGDTNYSGSIGGLPLYALDPTTTTISADTVNPKAGASVALSVFVDTPTKSPNPTGSVVFSSAGGPLPGTLGPLTLTSTTDASGNSELKATANYTPLYNTETVSASYTGDMNFASSSSAQPINIKVAGTDFLFYANPSNGTVTLTPGQTGAAGFIVDGQLNYTGTINFTSASCSGLPAEASCSFNPTSLAGNGLVTVYVATTAPSAATQVKTQAWHLAWSASGGLMLLGFGSLFSARRRRRRSLTLGLLLAVSTFLACGGGSSGGGGGGAGNAGTPTGNYTVTVTATSGSLSHSATFSMVVK